MSNWEKDFRQWLKRSDIVLTPAQDKVVKQMGKMAGYGTGKSFLIRILHQFDQRGS
jgi:hypothetical protein